ncbi:hypothetical protein D915_007322 [Fasciola hepatica]|uniref:Uncharacterized protein n=1 Tax=Fasciola hepatica TaxID=6192 RepID=A0A4E0R732_FASHE|nr:hypothetical protein D915_007322 [Fasciola hepatica]
MQVAIFNKGTFFTSNYLFTTDPIKYDPETDPLTSLNADQPGCLNPWVRREIKQLNVFSLCDQSNTHPPSTDEVETYVAYLDAGK